MGSSQIAFGFVATLVCVALVLERMLPGHIRSGPLTQSGHVPVYVDNGFLHCCVFTVLFFGLSDVGLGWFKLGTMFDEFTSIVFVLNVVGFLVSAVLSFKGIVYPSTADAGSTGSVVRDFLWGTELYPRVLGLDVKRFINSRISMTFWMVSGPCFLSSSLERNGSVDYGLVASALSVYIYLIKFFWWEMGYMRSIDIIVDRAGFTIQWGCLVWVPVVYTMHTRMLVLRPSGLSVEAAVVLFVVSLVGIGLNYAADRQREQCRISNGKLLVWGKLPVCIEAEYFVQSPRTGKPEARSSLLLASGFWGLARHPQYVFELVVAWSWCLLANPIRNGVMTLTYALFLTALLVDRVERDQRKCAQKYGQFYKRYCEIVPYKMIPGVY